ncbi:PDZ domain-containing protein [Chloroflexota bacterium]
MVKEYLSQRGIAFEERDVSRNPSAAQELVSKTGQMGVPVTLVDGQAIIGFDRAGLEQILSQQRPSFGATVADASKITAKMDSGITMGAYVGRVRSGSAAEQAGLLPDDIIIELNMQRITNADDLERALSRLNMGSRFSLVFLRGNKEFSAEGMF